MHNFLSLILPIHPEGYRFILIFAAATIALFFVSTFLGWLGVIGVIFCAYFFRDPLRYVPNQEGLIISPADGVVNMITEAVPPQELEVGETPMTRISIFLNVFNCHINRVPHTAKIKKSLYRTGKFLSADLEKASDQNERQSLLLELPDGKEMVVVQIAGLVARRILCWVEEGESLKTGERFGLIRFGSRVDVYLPDGIAPKVAVGQQVLGGETIMADLMDSDNQVQRVADPI